MTTCDRGNKLNRAVRRPLLSRRVNTPLESLTGVGEHAPAPRSPADHVRSEVGNLQEHIRCVLAHSGSLTTHDSGEAHGSIAVGDEQHVGLCLNCFAVEQSDLLPRSRHADTNLSAKLCEVVCVHGLTQLKQHIVGDVDNRADRTHAGATQPLAHPHRRCGTIVDSPNDAADEFRTSRRCVKVHGKLVAMASLNWIKLGTGQLRARQRCDFARNADDRQRVTAIRRDIQLEYAVVKL